eukprot:363828-Chlamydomonas_euryale.AAC.11
MQPETSRIARGVADRAPPWVGWVHWSAQKARPYQRRTGVARDVHAHAVALTPAAATTVPTSDDSSIP